MPHHKMACCAPLEAFHLMPDVPSTSYGSSGKCSRQRWHLGRRRGLVPPVRRAGGGGRRGCSPVLARATGGLPDDLSERVMRWVQRQTEQLRQAASSGASGTVGDGDGGANGRTGVGRSSSSGSSSSGGGEPDPVKPRSVWTEWSGAWGRSPSLRVVVCARLPSCSAAAAAAVHAAKRHLPACPPA